MSQLQRWLAYFEVRRHALPDAVWRNTIQALPLLQPLEATQRARLRVLTTQLIHRKVFTGIDGFDITLENKIVIAAQACLEILYLGIESFSGWREIVIYPGAFHVNREIQDEIGLVHQEHRALNGESWMQGPVILAWEEVERDSFTRQQGRNVVLHEFAHKLDMLNGRANGMPPLHPDMPIEVWTASLSAAFAQLRKHMDHATYIDSYAATDPAEFFAVMTEYFFTAPEILKTHYPAVYEQLRHYYRQNPYR